jgi:glutamate synthase (NADPH/NADH) large chain
MLLEIHVDRTRSQKAKDMLKNWDETISEMLMIVPKESAKVILGKTKVKKAG